MKLGAFNDDLHTEIEAAADLAAANELDGLAIRAVRGVNVADIPMAELPSIRQALTDRGLAVASIGSQFGRGLYVEAENAVGALDHLQRAIRAAEICGTTLVRVFAAWLRGQEPLSEWRRRPTADGWTDAVAELLAPAVRMAESAGITLMFELEGASYVGTVSEAQRLFAALGSPAAALCWDVCNGWWSGERPIDGLSRIGDLPVVDVQTKDVPAEVDNPSVASLGRAVVGEGDVGYEMLITALVRMGYTGWITAERVHHPIKPEEDPKAQQATLADIKALKRILATMGART